MERAEALKILRAELAGLLSQPEGDEDTLDTTQRATE